jgi:hypothetical protein
MAQTSPKSKTKPKSNAKSKTNAKPKSDAEAKSNAKPKTDEKPKRGTGPTNARARAERQKKLREIRKQVKDGTLTIRKMTAAERKKYPPRPPQAKSGRRRRG